MKKCSKCEKEQLPDAFRKDRACKDGRHSQCRACESIYKKANKEKNRLYQKQWRQENATYQSDWYDKNPEYKVVHNQKYKHDRAKEDPYFRFVMNMRSRLYSAMKGNSKNGSAIKDLGCSIDFFINYIEQQFQSGMSWDNYGRFGWHLDHIIPLASFDLIDRQQLLKACHYTNYQPLWWRENLIKGSKIGEMP